ncbi:alpha/beta hydrolase [Rhodoblastus sp. 17X3]|uniref:alpha/beta fold hydrolase n=1 Tax=Rhodoblastus sp. 17X3 TaxID=3047026 RepID=UPI0024B682D7|nr:alpha/beta hydrolase [Rhodoblastus sp. 17X3]MDI9848574.1 alpha/beta hydrolase [Rhodoblastus sp. 17X3]
MLRLSQVMVANVRTSVCESGPAENSEAVVFVHGNPGFSADWQDLMKRIAPFCRCVAPDMPGFGRSARPADFDYTVAGYANHLNAVLKKLGVARAHLVLHDFGGPWGLAWALANSRSLASLTLINIGLLPDYHWHYLAKIWRTPVVGEIFMATTTRFGFHMLLKHGNPRGLPKEFIDGMYDHFDAGTRKAVLRLYRATDKPGEMAVKFGDAFRSWTCPVLVVWGRRDPYLPVRYAERQREFFRQAQVHVLDDSGHWPHADDPDRVAQLVVPFLQHATSGRAASMGRSEVV